ncbi:MAG: spore coat protein CotJB [Bacillota bacterium]
MEDIRLQERVRLLRAIQELEFAAVEWNLFLDTHPDNREALEAYNATVARLNELKREYEAAYGPLVHFGLSPSAYPWRWTDGPWPWEIEY